MKKYYATVELIRSVGIELEADSENKSIEMAQKYADTLTDEDFDDGGLAIDWGLVDTVTGETIVPLGDVL